MATWFGRWFGYGFGAAAARAIFGDDRRGDGRDLPRSPEPIRHQSEEEFVADEKRFAEDEKRIEAQAKAERSMQGDER